MLKKSKNLFKIFQIRNNRADAIEMIKQRYIYFGIEEQVFIMYTTMDGYWDNVSMEKLPQANFFF